MKLATSYNTAYYGVDPDKIVAYAQHAEACGFEALYLPEHIVLLPDARVGSTEIPPSPPIADPLACLSFVAAATQRILLGTGGCCCLPPSGGPRQASGPSTYCPRGGCGC